tara:strand:- start:4070 stop:4342 length:273 start_codon:yes stop_codon:yes gene_type:complete
MIQRSGKDMRHKRTRAAITKTLKEKGKPMTAEEIHYALGNKSISNGKAVSNIIKGMKNVKVIQKGFRVRQASHPYDVNTYVYEDNEGAEI